ncbi:MAG: hypothetical protein ACTTKP_10875 [Catonella sp.]|uniref:hypothetical protein n=1 Tax=Clostridia TaxID=186801 RepID=UPI003FA12AE0
MLKNSFKKLCMVLLCSILVFSNTEKASAFSDENLSVSENMVVPKADYNSVIRKDSETTTYAVLNAEEIAKAYGITDYESITVTLFNRHEDYKPLNTPVFFDSIYVDNIRGPRHSCGATKIVENSSTNFAKQNVPHTVTITGTGSNTFSTNLGASFSIDANTISAGVGFNVTSSIALSTSATASLKYLQTLTVIGYPEYEVYEYDIMHRKFWGGTEKIGTGLAYRCTGFCTITRVS